MKKLEFAEIAGWLEQGPPPMLLLGAGASKPRLPVAHELKREILVQALKAAASISSANDDRERIGAIEKRLEEPHLTLELLLTMLRYRLRLSGEDVARLLRSALGAKKPNSVARAIAGLWKEGRLGPILTANVDRLLFRAIDESGSKYRLITKNYCQSAGVENLGVDDADICAFHGTLQSPVDAEGDVSQPQTYAPPISADMHGAARLFAPPMAAYLTTAFAAYPRVLVLGYSANDHFDMSPLLSRIARDKPDAFAEWRLVAAEDEDANPGRAFCAAAASLLQDPSAIGEDEPANELEWTERVSEFFSEKLASIQYRLDLSELIDDLERRLDYAWAVTERYQLDHFGYSPTEIRAFGGIGDYESADRKRYEGIAFGGLIAAQEEFWRLTQDGRAGGKPVTVDSVVSRFTKIHRDIGTALNRHLRDVDQAMLLIGQAICQNHMGLAEMHGLRDEGVSEDEAKKLRTKARTRFRRAIALAEQAKALAIKVDDVVFAQARDGAEGIVWQILPADLWELVARDNLCRTLDREEAVAGFRDTILARLRLVDEDDGAYAAGHYTQLCRLGLDLVTLVYRAGETRPPAEAQILENEADGGELLRMADWAIDEVMENAAAQYGMLTGDAHPALLAWFEARLIRAASQHASEAAASVAQEAQTFLPSETLAERPELAAAMERFRRLFEACHAAGLIGAFPA